MSRPRTYKTAALVLHKSRMGEADSLLVLYTPHRGKVKAVAKGTERPQSKLGGHVQPLSYSHMLLAQGQNLDIITQSEMIESFSPLHQELWRLSSALYAAELVDKFTAEGMENRPVFQLLLTAWRWLCQATPEEPVLRYFELHLLEHLGYRPQLHYCLHCGSPPAPARNFYTPGGGGVLCPACRPTQPAFSLSFAALQALRLLQGSDIPAARHLRLNSRLQGELELLLRHHIHYLLEQEVNSAGWLDKLRQGLDSPRKTGESR